jgi:HAE1 family hydrophobic/amphiphilic exporter-1
MSRLARLSLANRSLVGLAAVAVIVFGLIATASLKQELIPSLQLPAAIISTVYPGASPDIVEAEITRPIEAAVAGVDGLEETTSTSSSGVSVVSAEFRYGTDIDAAVSSMQQAVGRLGATLPQGADPTVQAGSIDDLPVVLLAADTGDDEQAAAERLRETVIPELEAVEGVRTAELTGASETEITVALDQAKLARAGLSPTAVTTALQANGVTIPGGAITEGGRTLSIDVGGAFTSIDELKALVIPPSAPAAAAPSAGAPSAGAPSAGVPSITAPAARPVRLGDVAEVASGLKASTSITRTDGRPTLGISVTKTADASTVAVSHDVRDKLSELEAALGNGARLTVVFDQAPFIEDSIEGLTTEGLLGLVFAVLVILLFLMSLRSTLVTAVSIPFSLLVAMLGLQVGGYSLNILTLGALTIAIGRVVDDSIVVLENIKRHLSYGEPKQEAILTAVREVAGAVTASTATTVAVFLPIAFVGGSTGELFRPFGITIAIALLASLLVSLTIIPVLAYWFLRESTVTPDQADQVPADVQRAEAETKERRGPLQRAYVPVISWATRHRAITVLIGIVVFLGTIGLTPLLETNFIDDSGQNTLTVSQELPAGTSLATTDAAAKKVEAVLADLDGVESYQATIGSAGFGGFFGPAGGSNKATFSVTTDPDGDTEATSDLLEQRLAALKDAGEVRLSPAQGFGETSIEVVVQAPSDAVLRDAAAQVEEIVRGTEGTTDVRNNLAADQPGIQVTTDRQRAAALGLGDAAIGGAVRAALEGQQAGSVVVDGDQLDVVVRGSDPPATVAALRGLVLVPGPRPVTLDDVADVKEVERPVQLTRTDGERSASVTAEPSGSDVGTVSAALQKRLDGLTLPGGATWTLGGVSADQQEAFAGLGVAMLAAIALVYLVMVATFRSLGQPLILLVSVPFAATGAIVLLLITGTALGVASLIGLLMLVGIVVTNAIVLIDLINQYREQGSSVRDAVMNGARQRLRPILMTAVATICALTPMALGLTGSGGFISRPLAIVVIGGLISSTLLTLVLVPAIYTIVEERKQRRRDKRALKKAAKTAPAKDEKEEEPVHATGSGAVSARRV